MEEYLRGATVERLFYRPYVCNGVHLVQDCGRMVQAEVVVEKRNKEYRTAQEQLLSGYIILFIADCRNDDFSITQALPEETVPGFIFHRT